MARTTTIRVRIEPEIKNAAQIMFAEFGLTITDAINVFLRQSLRYRKIPFEISEPIPTVEFMEAIEESRKLCADPSYGQSYSSLDSLFADLHNDGNE